MKSKLAYFLILIFSIFIGSCTTLRKHEQRVKIASEPEGAEIFLNGNLIGKTPAFVNLPRRKHLELTFKKEGFPALKKSLETHYRWGDSFAANFIWAFWGAPIGWTIDLLTGTAWNYEPMGQIQFPGAKSSFRERLERPRLIAIAPPQEDYELLSDELGTRLEGPLKDRYPGQLVYPYDKTHDSFNSYGYTNEHPTPETVRDDLYDELKATHVLETKKVTETDKGVHTLSELKDIYTDETMDRFEVFHPKEELKTETKTGFTRRFLSLISIIPNTFNFDTSASHVDMEAFDDPHQLHETYKGTSEQANGAWRLIMSLGLKNVKSPKLIKEFKLGLRFIPDVTLSYDRVHFEHSGPHVLENINYDWYSGAFGFGPEVDFDTPIGLTYLNVFPSLIVNDINGGGYNAVQTLTGASIELGYLVFISERFHLRLFTRTLSESGSQWNDVVAIHGLTMPGDVKHSSSGLAIGYYFPEGKTLVKKRLY